jgi:molybdenum cofactor sulfurtransferase
MLPNSFIEYAATKSKISLRTGCMCNPGGAAAILGVSKDMNLLYEGVTLKAFEKIVGRELGVVRVSLGLASNYSDVWHVLRFVEDIIGSQKPRRVVWEHWLRDSGVQDAMMDSSAENVEAGLVGRAL